MSKKDGEAISKLLGYLSEIPKDEELMVREGVAGLIRRLDKQRERARKWKSYNKVEIVDRVAWQKRVKEAWDWTDWQSVGSTVVNREWHDNLYRAIHDKERMIGEP